MGNLYIFLSGLFIAIAITHLSMSLSGVRFLSLFGFSPKNNLLYSIFCFCLSLIFYQQAKNFKELFRDDLYLAMLSFYLVFLIFGKAMINFFKLFRQR